MIAKGMSCATINIDIDPPWQMSVASSSAVQAFSSLLQVLFQMGEMEMEMVMELVCFCQPRLF